MARLLVRARGGERVVAVGERDDLAVGMHLPTRREHRIAGPVVADVVVQHDLGGLRIDAAHGRRHLGAELRMPLHDLHLFVRERAGLLDDVLAGPGLSHVVEQPAETHPSQRVSLQSELLADREAEDRHVHRVRVGVLVVLLEQGEPEQRALVGQHDVAHGVDHLHRAVGGRNPTEPQLRHEIHDDPERGVVGRLCPCARIAVVVELLDERDVGEGVLLGRFRHALLGVRPPDREHQQQVLQLAEGDARSGSGRPRASGPAAWSRRP